MLFERALDLLALVGHVLANRWRLVVTRRAAGCRASVIECGLESRRCFVIREIRLRAKRRTELGGAG
jgi:hypothetical protein